MPRQMRPDDPFCMLVLGDFSGRASSGICKPESLASRPVHDIDRDNFGQVFSTLQPRLKMSLGDQLQQNVELAFNELDDFHPDQLFDSVEPFAEFRSVRRRLQNRVTFAEAARQLGATGVQGDSNGKPDDPALSDEGSLLNAAVEATQKTEPTSTIDQLIQEIVAPFVIPAVDPRLPELTAAVDAGISELMRRLLHHPDFQQLEANWLSLYSLVRKVETDHTLKIQLIDVSLDEFRAGATNETNIQQCGLYQRIVGGPYDFPNQLSPAVVLGCWEFEPTLTDINLLGLLSTIAAAAAAPCLAAAGSTFVGCPSFGESPDPDGWTTLPPNIEAAWEAVRSQPAAEYLGLTAPKVLIRRPYTDDVESFCFPELTTFAAHSDYLWGNATLLCGEALGAAFAIHGWKLDPRHPVEFDGLPMHFVTSDGETVPVPSAECWLTSRGAKVLSAVGLMPLLSVQGRDAVQLSGFRSVGLPPNTLRGRWE